MGQQEKVATSLAGSGQRRHRASLAPVDAELARRYPGDPGTRQPVHTVYVPGDAFAADTIRSWGDQALGRPRRARPGRRLPRRRPRPPRRARGPGARPRTGQAGARARRGPAHRLRGRLRRPRRRRGGRGTRPAPPGWSPRPYARRAPRAPYMGIRMKCMEAAVRDRGIRTLDIFLTGLMEAGGLPDGLVLTLPKVTLHRAGHRDGAAAARSSRRRAVCRPGRIGFEIQIETSQSILAADGTATVARMIDAAEGRATGLHYGTFDYSACLGVSAAYQASDHPAADHAKAVMQVAAAGTGVRVSDGSTNVAPGRHHRAGPRRLAAALRPHPPVPGPRLLPGLGHAPRPSADPLRRRLRLLPRGLGAGRRPARRVRRPARAAT